MIASALKRSNAPIIIWILIIIDLCLMCAFMMSETAKGILEIMSNAYES